MIAMTKSRNQPKVAQAKAGPHKLSKARKLGLALLAAIALQSTSCQSSRWKWEFGPAHMDDTGAPALGVKFPGLADPDLIDYLDGTLPVVP